MCDFKSIVKLMGGVGLGLAAGANIACWAVPRRLRRRLAHDLRRPSRNMAGTWIDQMHAAAGRTGHGFIHAGVGRRIRNGALNFVSGDRTAI